MLAVIILGIIQGIAEFLPISSSAHLIIFRDVFGIGTDIEDHVALAFDIALHFGTLLAILLYFFKDFYNMIFKGLTKGVKDSTGKIFWFIVVATIPAAIVGLLFEDVIENIIRGNLVIILSALVIMGIIIYLADKLFKQERGIKEMNFVTAIVIGCSQIFALIPGFSRSGTTIAAARAMGVQREDSAKFSFYLSAPIVLGATIMTVMKPGMFEIIFEYASIFIIGVLVSFIAGLLCIEFLLRYIRKHDFKIFMWYRILLAVVVIIWLLVF